MRPIALGLAAVAAAFLVAFGIGKATNGTEASGAPARAESIQADDAAIAANVTTAAAQLPALKERNPAKKRKESKQSSDSSSNSTATPQDTSQSQNQTPAQTNTNPPPQDNNKPAPKKKSESGDSGGGITGGDN